MGTSGNLGGDSAGAADVDKNLAALLEISSLPGIDHLVVGAVITCREGLGDSQRVLLLRRHQGGFLGGFEDLPGGKAKVGETLLNTLEREVFEETHLRVEAVLWYVGEFDYVFNGDRCRQFTFAVRLQRGAIQVNPTEHVEYRWLDSSHLDGAEVTSETAQILRTWREHSPAHEPLMELRSCL